MDMVGLEYFLSAARLLNFTKAAEECCITQTAMSLHIAKIEKELGFMLFDRNRRSVSLTPGGAAFFEEADRILRYYRQGVRRSASAAAGFEGVLRLGYPNYIERAFLPELIGKFRGKYGGVEILLSRNDQNFLIQDLKRGMIDISVVFPYDVEEDDDICVEKIRTYDICAVVKKSHPLSGRERIRLSELQDEAVVISAETKSPRLYQRVRRDWLESGFNPGTVLEADSPDSMLFLVEAGFGNALMPSYIGQMLNDRLELLKLADSSLSIDMAVAYSRERHNSSVSLFLAELREFLERDGADPYSGQS